MPEWLQVPVAMGAVSVLLFVVLPTTVEILIDLPTVFRTFAVRLRSALRDWAQYRAECSRPPRNGGRTTRHKISASAHLSGRMVKRALWIVLSIMVGIPCVLPVAWALFDWLAE